MVEPTHLKNTRVKIGSLNHLPRGNIHIWNHHFVIFSAPYTSSSIENPQNIPSKQKRWTDLWCPVTEVVSPNFNGFLRSHRTRIDYDRGHGWRHFSWIHVYIICMYISISYIVLRRNRFRILIDFKILLKLALGWYRIQDSYAPTYVYSSRYDQNNPSCIYTTSNAIASLTLALVLVYHFIFHPLGCHLQSNGL